MMDERETIHIRCEDGPLDGQEFDVDPVTINPYFRVTIDVSGSQRTVLYRESYRYGVGMDRSKGGYAFQFTSYED